jgi:hypothetical protein
LPQCNAGRARALEVIAGAADFDAATPSGTGGSTARFQTAEALGEMGCKLW